MTGRWRPLERVRSVSYVFLGCGLRLNHVRVSQLPRKSISWLSGHCRSKFRDGLHRKPLALVLKIRPCEVRNSPLLYCQLINNNHFPGQGSGNHGRIVAAWQGGSIANLRASTRLPAASIEHSDGALLGSHVVRSWEPAEKASRCAFKATAPMAAWAIVDSILRGWLQVHGT